MDENATKRIPILEMAGSSISPVARILFREIELNSDSPSGALRGQAPIEDALLNADCIEAVRVTPPAPKP